LARRSNRDLSPLTFIDKGVIAVEDLQEEISLGDEELEAIMDNIRQLDPQSIEKVYSLFYRIFELPLEPSEKATLLRVELSKFLSEKVPTLEKDLESLEKVASFSVFEKCLDLKSRLASMMQLKSQIDDSIHEGALA